MSNQEEDEWTTVSKHRSQKTPQKGASLLSLESSASSDDTCIDDGSIHRGRSSSDVSKPGGQQTKILNEMFLQRVVDNIHVKDWKQIVRDLLCPHIKNVEVLIGDIEKDNLNDSREQKYQALLLCKSKIPGDDKAQYEALKATLRKHGCWEDSDQQQESVHTGGARKNQPQQKDTGAKPKVSQKLEYEVDDQKILTIKLGGSTEPLLQVKLKDVLEIDEVVVADALLISIITPNFANISFTAQMELTDLEERFYDKYGYRGLPFKNIGVGSIEIHVSSRGSSLNLQTIDQKKCIQVKSKLHVFLLPGGNYESDKLGKHEKPSELSLSTTEPSEWHPAQSKRSTKQIPKSMSETHTANKLFCQMPDAEQFAKLISKSDNTSVKFRTEDEYSGESGSIAFTKDVVAWWNTPRNGDVYLIVGVKGRSSPPHDLIGLQNLRINADYQAMFQKCFSHIPTFCYSEVQYSDMVFGVVVIPNSKGSDKVCWANETKGDEWTQNDILFCDGGTIMPANRKYQDQIYKWFHSPPDKTSLHRSSRKEEDEAWKEFKDKLDLENQPRRSYCLLVSQCSNETQHLQALAKFSWLQVWDFDPDSRESGFLAVCEADLQERLAVKTWNDASKDSLSETFIQWLFIRGLKKREDSLVLCSVRDWISKVGKHLNGYCDLLSTYCEDKPLTVVVVWYGSKDILPHLKRTLQKLDEHTTGITYIICMPQTPADEDGCNLMKELCQELEITKIIEISLERLCFGMLSIVNDQPNADLMSHDLPGSVGSISNRDTRWLQQELEVLYTNDELLQQEHVKSGEVFLRGGTLSWQEMHLGIFDAKRNLSTELNAFLQKLLHGGFSCIVTLFHEPGAGGTTLSRRILWDFHDQFPCVCAFADVIDPCKISQRLEDLYCRTKTPILLIVDGQESRLVQELFEMSQDKIHIVILSVQRFTKTIGYKTHAKGRFWLKGEVDSIEAQRLTAVFSQKTTGKTKTKLQKLVREVEKKQKHFVYEFGLTVYNEKYTGLRSYVRGYLALRRYEALTDWQKAVGYLALAFFYGHKCIPCQFFSLLFGKKDTEIVSACDVLTHSGKQFVLEDTSKCSWRITHHAVAKEILEQILTEGSPSNGEGNELSNGARRSLKEFAKDFLTYASKRLEHSKLDHSSSVMRTLKVIFIHRDYREIGQDQYRRELLSRLMCDIQGASEEKLDLMEHLVKCFPKDPTFVSHLGRAYNIYTHEFEKSLPLLNRAKELRQLEIKACAEKHCQSDTTDQGQRVQDAILCTIYHNLGILHHDQIKLLIGGGKLQGRKHYKGKPDEEKLFRDVCKYAQSAIHNFSTCRQYLKKGMDESYGYIGEIKVYLHIADYVAARYEQGGYYGFLNSKNNSSEAREFVESCFSRVNVLLREYQDSMKTAQQPEADELDSCLNWFSVIFNDADTALKYWKGKEDLESCRDKIAIYKMKHQGKSSAHRTPAHVLNNITSVEDVKKIVELYENIFRDAHRRNISIDVSTDLSDWIVAIRNNSLPSTIYSMSKIVLPQVQKCHNLTPQSITTLYYLYVVNATLGLLTRTTLGLLTQKKKYLEESNRLLGKLKEKSSPVNHKKFAWEWLRTDKERSIHCLVHRSCLGPWDSEKHFWRDESARAKLQVCTGVITACENPRHGRIAITTGGLPADLAISLSAVYVPQHYGLFGKNHLNRDVEFFIGFHIEHGIEAFNVCELKKSQCDHCKITVSVSRLKKSKTKLCDKCGHRIGDIS